MQLGIAGIIGLEGHALGPLQQFGHPGIDIKQGDELPIDHSHHAVHEFGRLG